VLAQLGNPDMRTPIAHALAYPERMASGVAPIDLTTIAKLVFERPDFARFPCLKLAYDALQEGGTAPAVLNAANEVAVEAFLNRKIGFRMIDQLITRVMEKLPPKRVTDMETLLEQDRCAREAACSLIPS
jgi:1-deoxy-D-xylulose-5-phosphate reductoisomerase